LNSGKTSMIVGIGTEAAFCGHKGRYLTFTKLRDLVRDPAHEPPAPRNTALWPWTSSQVLLIDDVVWNVPGATTDMDVLRGQLTAFPADVKAGIARRSTVWVIGDDIANIDGWTTALAEGLGISETLFIKARLTASAMPKLARLKKPA
jgi:hypothetical protein